MAVLTFRPFITFIAIAFSAGTVVAASASPVFSKEMASPWDGGTFNIQVENDLFANAGDRHYTNGIRLSYLSSPKNDFPALLRPVVDLIPEFRLSSGTERRTNYSLGHNIYTPADITRPDIIKNDRPYAGWLYMGLGLISKSKGLKNTDKWFSRVDNLEINIGMVGPASLAGTIQTTWHRWLGFEPPQGWDHQIHNEPGIMLVYERQWQVKSQAHLMGLDADVSPHVGAALGNVFTYASAGVTVRIGTSLPDDYGPPRIRPSLPGSGFFDPTSKYSVYLFGGLEGRAVARNIFLDGNTFRNSHSVDKRHFVGDAQLGLVLTTDRIGFMPPLRISYTYIFRSKEFHGQEFADKFGSINISFTL